MKIHTFKASSFNGKHNRVKGKAFLWLQGHRESYFTAHTLALIIGESEQSLAVLMPKWHYWAYLTRRHKENSPAYEYQITGRGISWFNRQSEWLMPVSDYIKEINEYQMSAFNNRFIVPKGSTGPSAETPLISKKSKLSGY